MKINKPRGHPRGFFMPKTFSHRFSFSRPRSILPVSFAPRPALILFPFHHSSHPRISTPPKLPIFPQPSTLQTSRPSRSTKHLSTLPKLSTLAHRFPLSFSRHPASLTKSFRPTNPPPPKSSTIHFTTNPAANSFLPDPCTFLPTTPLRHVFPIAPPVRPRLAACPPVRPAPCCLPAPAHPSRHAIAPTLLFYFYLSKFPPPHPARPPCTLSAFSHALISPFFCGRKGGCVARHFLAGSFFSPTFFAPFRIRSIDQCVRFTFIRLTNASVSRSFD